MPQYPETRWPSTLDSRPSTNCIAVFGGIYSNHLALAAAIRDARRRGCDAICCLGDLGAFGPHPDRVFPWLVENHVMTLQGNYDNSIGNDRKDCQCGYTDPRDNYFARLSYDYTYTRTSPQWRQWMRALPKEIRLEVEVGSRAGSEAVAGPLPSAGAVGDARISPRGGTRPATRVALRESQALDPRPACSAEAAAKAGSTIRLLFCHGSPRQMNEFLWESTTPTHFLEKLCADHQADVILATHTGIHWKRELSGGRWFVNVGVLGRPENDGNTNVWYTILRVEGSGGGAPGGRALPGTGHLDAVGRAGSPGQPSPPIGSRPSACDSLLTVEFIPLEYDHERLAFEMKQEGICDEFIETIETGWWTTCLEILPAKERRRGRF